MAEKKLYLLDAFALIFRAYYALIRNPRITSDGRNTSTQFGFTNTLVDILKNQKPSHIAVCFDTPEQGEREEKYAFYKANRDAAPEDLIASLPDIRKIVEAFNIPIVESPGYEADDVIGTLSVQAEKEGFDVFMVTPDKDLGQLVTDKVTMLKPPRGGKKYEAMGPAEICAKWDIERVDQVIDMLGLMGDASDNIPGIKGVGEKTAAKLLKQYDTLEGVLEHAEEIKGKLGEKVAADKANAIISKELATIILDVPCTFDAKKYEVEEWNTEELKSIFSDLEFRTLGKRILGDEFQMKPKAGAQQDLFGNAVASKAGPSKTQVKKEEVFEDLKSIENTKHTYVLVNEEKEIDKLIKKLSKAKEICIDTETTGLDPMRCDMVGMSFSTKAREACYVPVPNDRKKAKKIINKFKPLFENEKLLWIGQNLKYDLLVLKNYGHRLHGNIFDTMLAHYSFHPEGRRSMDQLSEQYLGYSPVSIESILGKKGKSQKNMKDIPVEEVMPYASEDADITLQLKEKFVPLIDESDVGEIFHNVETPLVEVLTDMEFEGIRVDEKFLNDYSKQLEKEIKDAEESVYKQADVRFNLASPKQLGEVLFDKLKLDAKAKKTKTGQYKTGEEILSKLAAEHKIVDDILSFRKLSKLKSTYVDALPLLIHPETGRVHTTYAQAVAVTGRLSSNNPNLQNIPIRTEKGREIRKAFIPRDKDHKLVSADYSQIELRIVAAISNDKNMVKAFKDGVDIHTATAAKVFGVKTKDVTKEQRYKAKSVNFGIIYGQGAFGLANNLGISRTEAKEIIDNYKKEFSGINDYMEDMKTFAKENGYVQTLMGRKRHLADINSSNFTVRGFAERNAINSPIQGTAADMIKLAMIHMHAALKQQKMQSKMLLQVHDELIFDAHKDELPLLKPLILEVMENAMPLPNKVPVVAELGEGDNWLEAH